MADELARPRGAFPHLRVVDSLVFVSGTSSRRPDDTIEGGEIDDQGAPTLDVSVQTHAVLANIEKTLATIGLDRTDLVDATTFLVDMNDFGPYNEAWAEFFDGLEGPARTTVAVHQLPHPHLLLEIKATARLRGEPA